MGSRSIKSSTPTIAGSVGSVGVPVKRGSTISAPAVSRSSASSVGSGVGDIKLFVEVDCKKSGSLTSTTRQSAITG